MAADWLPPIVPADVSVVPVAAAAYLEVARAVGLVAGELFSRKKGRGLYEQNRVRDFTEIWQLEDSRTVTNVTRIVY